MSPAFPDPIPLYEWLSLIEPPASLEDTRPCAAVDVVTEPLDVEAAYNLPTFPDQYGELAAALGLNAGLDGYTTPDYLSAAGNRCEQWATVAWDTTVTIPTDFRPGERVRVVVMREEVR